MLKYFIIGFLAILFIPYGLHAESPATYTISGRVFTEPLGPTGPAGIEGVTVNGLFDPTSTDADGYYTDIVPSGWSGTVTPTLAGYTFSPPSIYYPPVSSDQIDQDYQGYSLNSGDYYVDISFGTDDNAHGTSAGAGAWKTLHYAIGRINAGIPGIYTLHVASGTYSEANGESSSNIIITQSDLHIYGEGLYQPIIQGQGGSSWVTAFENTPATTDVLIISVTITGFDSGGLTIQGANTTIRYCYIHDNHGAGIQISADAIGTSIIQNSIGFNSVSGIENYCDAAVINGNTIYGNGFGIVTYNGGAILNNVILGNQVKGIYAQGGGINIFHNTIDGGGFAGNWGIYFTQCECAELSAQVMYNIISGFDVGIQVDSGAVGVDYNDLWNNITPYVGIGKGFNDISVDPLYYSDFSLQPGSPCIDAIPTGDPPGDPVTQDRNGNHRPIGAGFDMGAYEAPLIGMATNGIYKLFISSSGTGENGVGTFTLMTGDSHPFPEENILFGSGYPGTTYLTVRSYTSNTDYVSTSSTPSSSSTVISLDSFSPVVTPIGSMGYQTTWSITAPDPLTIDQVTNIEGTTLNDSVVRITTTVRNNGTLPVQIGIRYEWDWMIDGSDDAMIKRYRPDDSDFTSTFFEEAPPGFLYYEATNTPSTFSVFGTVNGPSSLSPPPTPPHRFNYSFWGDASANAWDFTVEGGGVDSAVCYYWGDTPSNAITINPGESYSVAQYITTIQESLRPGIIVTPTNLSFGDVVVGTTSDQTITVQNSGTGILTLGTIGSPSAPFSRAGGACTDNQNLNPGDDCSIIVRFAPTATGLFNSGFSIPSNDPDEPVANVSVSGTGTLPQITVTDSVEPIDDHQVPFGQVTVGNSLDNTVTIRNDGNADLVIGNVAQVDPLATPFSIVLPDNCSTQTLIPGASCVLALRFSPIVAGPFSDSFDIPSNDPVNGSMTVSVSGTGALPPVPHITVTDSVAPIDDHQVPFGQVTVGNSSDNTVTILNDGTANLVIGNVAVADPLAAPFSIVPPDNCSTQTLIPGASCVLTVRFSPTDAGPFNDSFDIPSNDPANSSVTVSVNGTGKVSVVDYYVDIVNGDDSSDGSQSHPWKTLHSAIGQVSVGGAGPYILHVASGIYNEANGEDPSDIIIIQPNLTIVGEGATRPVIVTAFKTQADNVTIDNFEVTGFNGDFTVYIRSDGAVIQNCKIHDSPNNVYGAIFIPEQVTNTTILGNEIFNNNAYAIWDEHISPTTIIERNSIHDNAAGISIWNNGTIRNNLIYRNQTEGIHAYGESIYIYHNTIDGGGINGDTGIHFVGGSGGAEIKYNIITGFDTGIEVDSGAVTVDYNDLCNPDPNNPDPEFPCGPPSRNYAGIAVAGPNDISVDPLYKDPVNGDFTLQTTPTGSPCIDAIPIGDSPGDPVTDDYNGSPRPQGLGFDMGAYETTPVPHITVTDSVEPINDHQVPFGQVTVGNSSDSTVTIRNDGTANLVIGNIAQVDPLAAPFSIVLPDNCSGQTLGPLASCVLTVRFSPIAAGPFSDSFDIPSNDSVTGSVTVSMSGTGSVPPVPHITVTDSVAPIDDHQVPFGQVTVGNSSDSTVTIQNDGNANLVIGNIAQVDPLAAPFSIVLPDNCSGQTLGPLASCVLTVRFSPIAAGPFSDSFDIPSNDSVTGSVTVSMSGTGSVPPVPHITVTDSVAPIDDHQVPFGQVTVGNSSDSTVTIQNDGNANLVIGSVAQVDPLAAPFSIVPPDNCSGQILIPGASCVLTVRFSATDAGVFSDSFDIPSNDPVNGSVTVSVSGTGTLSPVPHITVTDSVAPIDDHQVPFGQVTMGNSSDNTVTIQNDGNANLVIGSVAQVDPLAAPFSIVPPDNCSGQILIPGASCVLTVRFSATDAGVFSDSFDIPSNDPVNGSVTVSVSGTGTLSPVPHITVTDSVAPIDDHQVPFGQVTMGNSSDNTVTIRSDGTANLAVGNIAQANSLAAPFSIVLPDNCSGQTLIPGASCVLTVRFSPGAAGPFSDSFDIPSNDPVNGSVTVSVSGTGGVPPVPHITVTDSVAPVDDHQVPLDQVTVGNSLDGTVTILNDGNANLVIGNVGQVNPLATPFSIVLPDNCSTQTLIPGASCVLTVRFSPIAAGSFSDSFDIPSNDPVNGSVTMGVSGTGSLPPVPHITVTDSVAPIDDHQVPFGQVTVGNSLDSTVTIRNDGNADLVIGNVARIDPLATPFSIVLPDNCSGQTLIPGASCVLTVRFSPTDAGVFSDSFDIPSNDPVTSSVTVSVSGTGTLLPVPHITVTDSVEPINDHQVPFGQVTVGNSSDSTVTIRNDGTANLVIGNIAQVNPLAAPFSIVVPDNCSGQTLIPGGSCVLTVRFSPTDAGVFSDSFDIPSNDPVNSSVTVSVSGTGGFIVTVGKSGAGSGTITGSPPGLYAYGTRVILYIEPDATCRVSDVTIDGISIGPVNTVTIREMMSNHTVNVTFEYE